MFDEDFLDKEPLGQPQQPIIACSTKEYQGRASPTTFYAVYDGVGWGGVEKLTELAERMLADSGPIKDPKLICGVAEGHVNTGTDSGGRYEFRGFNPSEEAELLAALKGN